jgi:hypothetical protein
MMPNAIGDERTNKYNGKSTQEKKSLISEKRQAYTACLRFWSEDNGNGGSLNRTLKRYPHRI